METAQPLSWHLLFLYSPYLIACLKIRKHTFCEKQFQTHFNIAGTLYKNTKQFYTTASIQGITEIPHK